MLIAGACSVRTWRLIKLPCVFGHIPFTRRRRMFAMTMCSASTTTSNLSKKKNKEKVIVISGPTGAGKSRLALELAKRLNGEIISADSVQVYQGLDVGSAKPSACDRKEVPHHLVDILHPSEDYSVGKFFEDARQATRDILNSGRVPIVTGGTGLYLRWFIYGKPDVPKASQDISSKVYSELMILQRRGDWDAAVQLLVKAGDPKAQSLASNDWYRLRRSLEIIKSSGLPPSAFPVPYDSFRELSVSSVSDCSHGNDINSSVDELEEGERDLEYEFICFFLSSQRLDLYRSIDFRCEDMLSGKEIYYWYPMYSMYLLFEIKGCKIARNCTSITHLMFADDLVMFGPALVKEAEALKSCLDLYCKWSGQVVNRAKSGIHFSKGTDSQKAMDIRSVMNMGGIAKEAVYLGMPLFPARSKNLSFNYILERMTNRIHGWKLKLLSYAGRATMIIAVAAALPAYVMAVNDLPSNLCGKMDQAMRGFWWGHKNKRGLCLKKWEKVCLPKSLGGMGFRQMKENNQALLSKLAWQMAANEDRFWVEQVRSKYCSRQAFMHVEKRQSDAMMWKGILNCRSLIEKGACFVIGDGASVNVWTDPWVPSIKGFKVILFLERDDIPMLVEGLIDKDRREWKLDELKSLFDDQTIEAILEIDIPMEITEDKLCWIPSRDGDFSVKSAYRLGLSLKLEDVIASGMVSSEISRLWKANMQEQLKVFLWRCLKGCIPTRSNLSRRMPIDDKECLMCGHEEETSIHVFFECPFAKAAWFVTWNLRTELFNFSSCGEWFEAILKDKLILCLKEADVDACAVATTMEEIWKWRNA